MVAAPARKKRFTWTRNLRVGVGAIAVAAAAVAVVSVTSATQAPPPGEPAAQPQSPVVESRLVTLAADVKASGGSLPGDASLVIRTTTAPDGKPYVTYNLYTDKGEIFFADERSALTGVVVRGDNLAESYHSSVIAAARFAAGNDLDKARVQMINASRNRSSQVWTVSAMRFSRASTSTRGPPRSCGTRTIMWMRARVDSDSWTCESTLEAPSRSRMTASMRSLTWVLYRSRGT